MNILEARIEFKKGKLDTITVLNQVSQNDIRAIQGTTQPKAGYMTIHPYAILDEDLLKEVADYGMEIDASKAFPNSKHL